MLVKNYNGCLLPLKPPKQRTRAQGRLRRVENVHKEETKDLRKYRCSTVYNGLTFR